MATFLFIDGENFKGKMRSVFREAGRGRPVWHEYDFKGLLDKVLAGIALDRKVFYFARIKAHEERKEKSQQLIEEQRLLKTHLEHQGFGVVLSGRVRGQMEIGDGGRMVLVFKEKGVDVPKGIVASAVLRVIETKQSVKIYNGYGDVDAGRHDRNSTRRGYAVRFRNRIEADEEWKEKSAADLKKLKVVGTTLTERLLLESIFVATTGNHLDIVNATYCTGSRDPDGHVPGVYWYDGELYVNWCPPSCAYGCLRVREAVS